VSYYDLWSRPYVSVAEKRRRAEHELARLKKAGQQSAPVKIEGRKIARTFWGEAWCTNLERYSDYANRLPRGRSYVRNGSVVDLQITKGEITALVAGSDLYTIEIVVAPVTAARWQAVCRDCSGTIDSLVELLQGRLAKSVMERMCRAGVEYESRTRSMVPIRTVRFRSGSRVCSARAMSSEPALTRKPCFRTE